MTDQNHFNKLMISSFRIGMYLLLVLLTVGTHLLQMNFYNWELLKVFYLTAFLGLILHLIPVFNLEKFYANKFFLAISLVIDLMLISFLMLKTDINQSVFIFMYLFTIILSGLIFRTKGALLVAVTCAICFSSLSLLNPEVKALSYVFMLLLNNIAFFTVAAISGYLSDQINFLGESLLTKNLSIRAMQSMNEMIVETVPSLLITTRKDGSIVKTNSLAEDYQIYKGTSLISYFSEFTDVIKNADVAVEGECAKKMDEGESLFKYKMIPQEKDWLGEETILWVLEDQTDLKKMEFTLRQSEKMAAIGQLAAGIAHEIRNPLAGISGSVELLSQNFKTEEDQKLSKIILREIDRLNNLISEFLDFAKPDKPPGDRIDLKTLLKEVMDQNKLSQQAGLIQSELSLEEGVFIVGHKDKLKQAFLNIVINAFQAMEKSENKRLNLSLKIQNGMAVVKVKDSGNGMSEETKLRMFEPFHTTKPKGTGLGLAITHKIFEAHKAIINVESQLGLGTEFVISFPSLKQ